MKAFVKLCMVFCLTLFGLGSALKCYECTDSTGSCTEMSNCAAQLDGCLTLKQSNGQIFRQCIRYSDCKFDFLATMFPSASSFDYKCCNQDLCNGAFVSAARTSAIALLFSLALFWWCIF